MKNHSSESRICENKNNESYKVSYVYRISPVKYSGKLNENKKGLSIKIVSENRLNRKQILEKTQKYFKKKYDIFVESLDVTATGEVSGDSLKLIHNVIESTIPTFDVYDRKVVDGESLNGVEAKNLIDNILTGDITEMLGSSQSMMERVKSKLKELEEKVAKVYRVYKDGVALDTFIKKVCKLERDEELNFYGNNIKETLKMVASIPESACDVNLISCEKDYCLVLVIEK